MKIEEKGFLKRIKRLFCKHNYDNVTFIYYPDRYEIRECIKCGKTEYFDI